MAEELSPRELERRRDDMRDEMRSGFAQINSRFDKVPTSELLMAHPNVRWWNVSMRRADRGFAGLRRAPVPAGDG